jgi:hypothetical protein
VVYKCLKIDVKVRIGNITEKDNKCRDFQCLLKFGICLVYWNKKIHVNLLLLVIEITALKVLEGLTFII